MSKAEEIAVQMKAAGLPGAFVDAVLKATAYSDGFTDLMEIWAEMPSEREAVISDLYQHLKELK